jgi:cytochrome c553
MLKKTGVVLTVIATLMTATIVQAQGDIQAGKQESTNCVGCHGSDGNSMVSTFPKLAGQHASYLVKQLHAFQNGSRHAPMMVSFAKGLSNQAIDDVASFYALQPISANPMPRLKSDDYEEVKDDGHSKHKPVHHDKGKEAELNALLTFGGDLYRNGDLDREVSACIACHGPAGEGNKPAGFPSLKGQHADYLIQTLTDFKTGTRVKNPDNMMQMIAAKMTEKEIRAVSYYLSVMK